MSQDFQFCRKIGGQAAHGQRLADILPDWQGTAERWAFVSAHDDDTVIGAGLLILAARAEAVEIHALVTSDGRMGYCTEAQRGTITQIGEKETIESFGLIGVPPACVHFLQFPDCSLGLHAGRRVATSGSASAISGHDGLQNAYVHHLRRIAPTRVFMPTSADLHPDHKITNQEFLISIFHACGAIWPELGAPLPAVPAVYEYACYCDFPETPQIRVQASGNQFDRKMHAVGVYRSQMQIEQAVATLRAGGSTEYIRELRFETYSPAHYEGVY